MKEPRPALYLYTDTESCWSSVRLLQLASSSTPGVQPQTSVVVRATLLAPQHEEKQPFEFQSSRLRIDLEISNKMPWIERQKSMLWDTESRQQVLN